MLGQDSLVLRTLLQTGQEVLFHLNGNLTSTGDQRREQAKKNDELIGKLNSIVQKMKNSLLKYWALYRKLKIVKL